MHNVTTIDKVVTLVDGARFRVAVRGSGTQTVLFLDDHAPHRSAMERLPEDEFPWHVETRIMQCDSRWAATGWAGLIPFDHQVAAADRIAALDACSFTAVAIVAIGQGVPQALALAALAPDRVHSMVLLDPLVIGSDRSWDDLAGEFDEAMRFVRAHGFDGLRRLLADDPLSSSAGPFGPQLARDADLAEGLSKMGRERYIARVVAFRDGLYPDRPLISVTADEIASYPRAVLVVPHPERPASASELAAALPKATLSQPEVPAAAETWRTVSQFLHSV
mgnify:CR=1 FL=1